MCGLGILARLVKIFVNTNKEDKKKGEYVKHQRREI